MRKAGTDFVGAEDELTGADLRQAQLQGAILRNACLNDVVLTGAAFDEQTEFPALFFDPEGKGAIVVAKTGGQG